MSGATSKLALAGATLIAMLAVAPSASAEPKVDGIFPLDTEIGTNNKIVAGPDGNVWLTVNDATKDVARVTSDGAVEEFDIEGIESAVGIAPGPDGNLWITDVEEAAKFAPADPEGTDKAFPVPGIGAEGQIVAGPDGRMWVASGESVVHFDPVDPPGTVVEVTVTGMLAPKDIDRAGDLLAIADGSSENRIVTLTPAGVQQDFAIAGASQGLAGNPSGQIAFTAPIANPQQVGLIGPPNPAQSFDLPGDPFGAALGADGAYWIPQFVPGQLARVTTTGQVSFLPGLPVESARQIAVGPNNTLWVTLTKLMEPGAVARVTGVEPPPLPTPAPPGIVTVKTELAVPDTRLRGPRAVVRTVRKQARVKFRFSSNMADSSFRCALTKLRKGGKSAAPKFAACSSPRTYARKPGRYRFEVAAVRDGQVDATPARRTFRIVRAS